MSLAGWSRAEATLTSGSRWWVVVHESSSKTWVDWESDGTTIAAASSRTSPTMLAGGFGSITCVTVGEEKANVFFTALVTAGNLSLRGERRWCATEGERSGRWAGGERLKAGERWEEWAIFSGVDLFASRRSRLRRAARFAFFLSMSRSWQCIHDTSKSHRTWPAAR